MDKFTWIQQEQIDYGPQRFTDINKIKIHLLQISGPWSGAEV